MRLDDYELIEADIDAGGGATIDIYFDSEKGTVLEDKTTRDGTHLYSEISVEDDALDNLTDGQIEEIADCIINQSAQIDGDTRKLTNSNEDAYKKLVAEMEYEIHEIHEIKEAISDYYG